MYLDQTKIPRFCGGFFCELFYRFNHLGKHRGLVFGEEGKRFAIKCYAFTLQCADKAAIGEPERANSGIDFYRPEFSEITLLGAAVAEGITASLEHGRAGEANAIFAAPAHAFYFGEEGLAALYMADGSFNAWHRLGIRIGHTHGNRGAIGFRKGMVAALAAGLIPRVSGIEVILTLVALQNLSLPCNTETLADGLIRFELHNTTGLGGFFVPKLRR